MITPLCIRPFRPLRRRALSSLAALAALPLLTATAPAGAPEEEGKWLADRLATVVTAEGVMRHLATFQRIANADDGAAGGSRAAGTPGHERSARYAATLLRAVGYDVTHQRFDFPYRETTAERLTRLDGGGGNEGRDVPVRVMRYSPNTPDGGIAAELAEVTGTGCADADYAGGDVAGRIALIARGACDFADKQRLAADAGAVAALIYNDAPGRLSGSLGEPGAAVIPTGGLTRADGRALAHAERATLRLELGERGEKRTTFNVIAETPGGDDENVVMAGGHLDSVAEGPGINDNASGAAGILETALRLGAERLAGHDHRNTVRFALWSAEESGLLGSQHYVSHLTADEREDIALYLNFDMIGSPNPGIFVYDGEGGPPGSSRIERDISAFLRSRGATPRPTAFDGRSDYGPFVDAGIPAGGIFTGAEGVKSRAEARLWGGEAGAAYDPCYHESCDDTGNISRETLGTNARAIAHMVGTYASDTPE
jgi:peptidase M28-like protein/PA domain-containing protein